MHSVRLWSVRHAGGMGRLYRVVNPALIALLARLPRVFDTRLDGPITHQYQVAQG